MRCTWMLPSLLSGGKEPSTAVSMHGVILQVHITMTGDRRVGELPHVHSRDTAVLHGHRMTPGCSTADSPQQNCECSQAYREGKPTESICTLVSLWEPSHQAGSRSTCWPAQKAKLDENRFCSPARLLQPTTSTNRLCVELSSRERRALKSSALLHCLQYAGTGPAALLRARTIFNKQHHTAGSKWTEHCFNLCSPSPAI